MIRSLLTASEIREMWAFLCFMLFFTTLGMGGIKKMTKCFAAPEPKNEQNQKDNTCTVKLLFVHFVKGKPKGNHP